MQCFTLVLMSFVSNTSIQIQELIQIYFWLFIHMINFLLRNQFLCMLSLSWLWATLAKETLDSAIILPISAEILLWCGGLVFSQINNLTLVVWSCRSTHPEVKRNGCWIWQQPTVRVSILRCCTADAVGSPPFSVASSLHYCLLCFIGESVGDVPAWET